MTRDFTCYFYHRDGNYDVTVAYTRDPDNGGVFYGAAFCGPEDQFNKRMGRAIARGRMDLMSEAADVEDFWGEAPVARWQVHEFILKSLSDHAYGYIPDNFVIHPDNFEL
jgi:hypothetical protein